MGNRAGRPEGRYRYGIGEWYGYSFARMSREQRNEFAELQQLPKRKRPVMLCKPRGGGAPCTKEGGVCSIRLFHETPESNKVTVPPGALGNLVTTCPCRFDEAGLIHAWIGEEILGCSTPQVVGEVGFLERTSSILAEGPVESTREDVGRIDSVLVHPDKDPMQWCALEIQAVYFSGAAMSKEFPAILAHAGRGTPFPVGHRRPDYRSSGPKRLMPQLQIKVPTLRRWGKKMAVAVDDSFFGALGRMDDVGDVSNADIAWFIVRYDESGGEAKLRPSRVYLTTLERAVEGLTAGHPVSLQTFESRIREKLERIGPTRPPN